MSVFYLLVILGLSSCFTDQNLPSDSGNLEERVKGLTLVAPPKPFPTNPMDHVKQVHANWIAVVPYAYTPGGKPEVRFNLSDWQWWGETPAGVLETIRLAQDAGIQVMLKPQVWSHQWWTGDYNFSTNSDWEKWENAYEDYIMYYTHMADSLSIPLFCMGTEFKTSIRERPEFWYQLIDKVRTVYHGSLTYAANWDNYQNIPFWDRMDLVGINAYFPLEETSTPTVTALAKAWQKPKTDIGNFQRQVNKPILFTEYGYLSVDACAHRTWELEDRLGELSINEAAQANALEALYTAFWNEPYWEGGFLWKWFPNMQGHEGHPEKDYTPQGKLGEKVLIAWFRG
ncbi:MAG: hypothetical protein OEQ53_02290 [Saprospiraceae bacterium]|nr:hypothetical protein [Saprospiraceae bacterium]